MPKKILIVEDEFIIADLLKSIVEKAGYEVCGFADNVDEALKLVALHSPEFVLIDIYLKGKASGIELAILLGNMNVPFLYISANSNQTILERAKKTNPYGFVVKPFREYDVLVALDIANYRFRHSQKKELHQVALLQKSIANIINTPSEWLQKIVRIGQSLQTFLPFDLMTLVPNSSKKIDCSEQSILRIAFDEYQIIGDKEMQQIAGLNLSGLELLKNKEKPEVMATWYEAAEFKELISRMPYRQFMASGFAMESHLALPVFLRNGEVLYLYFYSRRPDTYNEDHLILCNRLQAVLTEFGEKIFMEERSGTELSASLNPESQASRNFFEGIIGKSHLLLNVFDNVMQVAPVDSSVLILGESGTGKEKIADRIHHLSLRKSHPFIKINCAALPASLIDSELFGHERGAFTGAYERKIGKFEQAHLGTIFLDEIGEIPLELQVKLLRVLQEKEIERIGGRVTIKTDVRIIAATNRNLEKEVAEGRFRLDLYYRLNVFPILMPPLRDRREDIPELTSYFLQIFNKKTGKHIVSVSEKSMNQMMRYTWPGNIRELENVMERNVLMAKSNIIDGIVFPENLLESSAPAVEPGQDIVTMIENERNHILMALKSCNGKIWGSGGAAELLNLPPTTLNSKMKKLGIKKDKPDFWGT
ncbi:sigma 54-interacting transcriptional regulator [Pedobacter sp. FW305-3-2-15-E-R2A2]|uniref:sigma 54-interacting transcriptional regulator n=1 Tax=Pedobacter sp. FW305-3-2-15-E-R2A2 TaxID=3140251 RepID=UPI003140009D